MHGFDYNGCQRDKDGSINNWWTNASTNSFQKHLKCFKDQFKVYQNVSGHLKYDEMLTLNENIADSEGLRIAYHAFRKWTKDHGPEEEYPNLSKYTPEQMFFIAFGSMWCSKINTDMHVALSKDSHSLPEFRVLGSVSNSKDFAEAFHCAKGSPMNPATKCSLF
ncbi:Endothelin-converting enzyme-like 1, partial [Stegodyphus mimosarum]